MKETEITVRVFENKEGIKNKLLNNKFQIAKEVVMIDYYFSKETAETLKDMGWYGAVEGKTEGENAEEYLKGNHSRAESEVILRGWGNLVNKPETFQGR